MAGADYRCHDHARLSSFLRHAESGRPDDDDGCHGRTCCHRIAARAAPRLPLYRRGADFRRSLRPGIAANPAACEGAKGKANQSAGDGQWSRQTSRSKCGTTGSAKRLELSSDSIERGWRFFFLHWRKSHALWWATIKRKGARPKPTPLEPPIIVPSLCLDRQILPLLLPILTLDCSRRVPAKGPQAGTLLTASFSRKRHRLCRAAENYQT